MTAALSGLTVGQKGITMATQAAVRDGVSDTAAAAIRQQSASLNQSLGFGVVAGAAFYALAHGVNPVPIVGPISLARPGAVIGAISIGLLFFAAFLHKRDPSINRSRVGLYFNCIVLAVASAIIGLVCLGLVAVTMESAFAGLAFDPVTASALIAGAAAAIAYITLRFTQLLTVQRIYAMLVIVLFGGIILSAIASQDTAWYNLYLSALGMSTSGPSAKLFNFSLIFSGVMLVALANVLFGNVARFYRHQPTVGPRRYHILYGMFVLCGAFLAGVGAFPFVEGTVSGRLHQISAGLLGVVFVIWMVALRWLIPLFDRSFYVLSMLTAAAIAIIFILSTAHIYFNVTGLEVSVFLIATAWLSLYLTNMFNAALESGNSAARRNAGVDKP
jgi:hypothetical protein